MFLFYGLEEDKVLVNIYENDNKSELVLFDVKNQSALKRIAYNHGLGVQAVCGDKVFVGWGTGSTGDMPWRYISLKEFLEGSSTIHEIVQPESFWD